jgi:Golgi phosphoprotein 3 GPP34
MSPLTAPPTYVPSIRGDAMLITHGREGTERLLAVALLLDAVLDGHLELAGAHLVAGPESTDAAPLLADLRVRVLEAPRASPRTWVHRVALFAPGRVAAELVAAGAAEPLPRRFQRRFTLSVDAHAEADARRRVLDPSSPALAAALYVDGGFSASPFPPPLHTLPPAARAVLASR